MKKLTNVLGGIGVSPSAQKIYLSLLEKGEATAVILSKRTGMTRPSVYDQLNELRNTGLVGDRTLDGKKVFATLGVHRLEGLLSEKIEELEEGREDLKKNMQEMIKNSQSVQPRIRFFEGQDGVQQLMKDILWHDDVTLLIYWPYKEVVDAMGVEFLQWFNERRIKYEIHVKTIWPHKEKKQGSHIFEGADDFVQRRYAKKNQKAQMSYLIYDDSVIFISSSRESFGYVVESREHAELMRMQFESLWENAQK